MRYCRSCVIPETRPNSEFNEKGICAACVAHASRRAIDWKARRKAFRDFVKRARSRSRGYDCVIPVSGGKDSTWQVVIALRHGLKPLAVTWKTPARTEIGERNLKNLVRLGVDHMDFQVNPDVERRFMYEALVRFGSTAIPMHMALFSIPLNVAVRFDIPLVIWGENSAFEYGGTAEARSGFVMDEAWLQKYGVTHGTTAEDWVSRGLSRKELLPYFRPTENDLKQKGIKAVFLGYYFPWDVRTSYRVAARHGFEPRREGPKTGYYNFADIDDDFLSVHHYLKWYKFGFTRLFDNLSLEIRNRRLSREQAIRILREQGEETPYEDIEKLCRFLRISTARFFRIAERFRNRKIWYREDGKYKIRDFLVPGWRWS